MKYTFDAVINALDSRFPTRYTTEESEVEACMIGMMTPYQNYLWLELDGETYGIVTELPVSFITQLIFLLKHDPDNG